MSEQTDNPIRMRTPEASKYLKETHGIDRAQNTLNKLACIGGGPAFRKAGARTRLYDRDALDRWALEILGPEFENTAEAACTAEPEPATISDPQPINEAESELARMTEPDGMNTTENCAAA